MSLTEGMPVLQVSKAKVLAAIPEDSHAVLHICEGEETAAVHAAHVSEMARYAGEINEVGVPSSSFEHESASSFVVLATKTCTQRLQCHTQEQHVRQFVPSWCMQATIGTLPFRTRHWVVPAASAGPWTHPKLVIAQYCSHGCKDMYPDMALRVFFAKAAIRQRVDGTLPTKVCSSTVNGGPVFVSCCQSHSKEHLLFYTVVPNEAAGWRHSQEALCAVFCPIWRQMQMHSWLEQRGHGVRKEDLKRL